jgi:hypothetical protein
MSSTAGGGPALPETDALVQRVAGMIAGARALPLSSSVKLDNKEEILELLREAIERLPEELRQARWMLKERDEFLASTQRKADELVESARSEAQRMVQRTEIVKDAQAQARRTLESAREEARRLRLEAEDYADQRLAQFEIILERTLKTVAAGRQKLSGLPDKDEDTSSTPSPTLDSGPVQVGSAGAGPTNVDKRRLGTLGARRPSGPLPGPAGSGAAHGVGPQARNGSAFNVVAAVAPDGGADEQLFDQDLLG